MMESRYRQLRKIKLQRLIEDDEDVADTISNRLSEVQLMIRPRAELGNFIASIDPEQRAKIMKYKDIDYSVLRKQQRKNWTPKDKFRHAVSMVTLFYRACGARKKYLIEEKPDTAPGALRKLKQKNDHDNNVLAKSSIGIDMQLALSTQPDFRVQSEIKRVAWVLKATKAFKHLIPSQVESELARVLAYERYDDHRILAYQGREPERFYYILTGKVMKVREYRLLSGVITRTEGYMEKGQTTDAEELQKGWLREHNLVSKGQVEVLIIEKSDFLRLQHTSAGPPIDFLSSLDLFKEFPVDEFLSNPDALDFKYYAHDNIVVKDANRTPWIHVVKTGAVKVVRVQTVIDVQQESQFTSQGAEEPGCKRTFSHAGAMLGFLSTQRKMKTILGSNSVSLPEILQPSPPELRRSSTELLGNPLLQRRKSSLFAEAINQIRTITRRHKPQLVSNIAEETKENGAESKEEKPSPRTKHKRKPKLRKSPIVVIPPSEQHRGIGSATSRLRNIPEEAQQEQSEHGKDDGQTTQDTTNGSCDKPKEENKENDSGVNRERTLSFVLPPIIDGKSENSIGKDFHPHGTYLTRERTEYDPVYAKKPKKEPVKRKAFLQLDVLKPGDIFGLDAIAARFKAYTSLTPIRGEEGLEHMDPPLASEPLGVSLISDGAEIIRISKRFFLTHAQNNTMLKVETMQREYMSPEAARSTLYTKETWDQYKSVLLQRMVSNLVRYKSETA